MKEHLKIIDFNDERLIHFSAEIKGILDQLLQEDKFLGLIFIENEIKVVEIEDYFDITKYDVINQNLTIIIDRNLFIAARELYEKRALITSRHSFFTLLLAYAIFTNAIFDPAIAIYEGGDNNDVKALEDIKKLRVIDNLPLDIVLDLIYAETDLISAKDLQEARKKTKKLKKETIEENYNKQLTLFKQNYPYMLKATLLLRIPGLNLYRKIKYFFDWMMQEYITNAAAITFILFCFYKNGGVLKDYKSNDYTRLITSVQNATWDVTLISYLKDQSKKYVNRYFLLTTLDKNLLEAAKYFFSPDETRINALFGNKQLEVRRIINKTNEICSLPGRKDLILKRLNNVDNIIISLENEIKKSIQIDNN